MLSDDRLLKRRQIRYSRPCALATAVLLRRVVSGTRNADSEKLLKRVREVGRRLLAAQPRELVVGNIVRRVLGLIREEAEDDRTEGDTTSDPSDDSRPATPLPLFTTPPNEAGITSANGIVSRSRGITDSSALESLPTRPPLLSSHTTAGGAPPVTSMFSLLSHPASSLPTTPGTASPRGGVGTPTGRLSLGAGGPIDLRAEVIEGIGEIIDELDQADEQIAGYALEHIHSNEVILTHTSSLTVQRFLLKAATKRKFTVIHAESYPNNHHEVHASLVGSTSNDEDLPHEAFSKPLTSAGITVILIPDSAVFALMSRVNKVILGTHAVLANGGLIAAAGARVIAMAARAHRTPLVVLSGIFKLSPSHPFDPESYIEYGDVSKIFPYQDGSMVGKVDVENPIYDFVPPDLVDLYITNLGGHAPSYLYRIVQDHYREEDIDL